MAALTKMSTSGPDEDRKVDVKIDIGKTLALVILGIVILVASLVLFLSDNPTPAAGFFALGEAIVISGLGVAYGEKTGAESAAKVLRE